MTSCDNLFEGWWKRWILRLEWYFICISLGQKQSWVTTVEDWSVHFWSPLHDIFWLWLDNNNDDIIWYIYIYPLSKTPRQNQALCVLRCCSLKAFVKERQCLCWVCIWWNALGCCPGQCCGILSLSETIVRFFQGPGFPSCLLDQSKVLKFPKCF